MKFDKKNLLLVGVLLILSVSLVSSFRKDKFQFFSRDEPISGFVNRGFSYLNNDKDIFKDVEKLVTKKQIFNHDIDPSKKYFGDFYVSEEHSRSALNRNVTNFNTEEMLKNEHVTLRGSTVPTVGSDVYKFAVSHTLRRSHTSHIFADTVGRLSLSMNHNKNFPNLHNDVVEEAYKAFYESPNKNAESHTLADLISDKSTIKAAIKFFTDFGTHYISESQYGYRFGFYQEHKNKTTVLKNKKGDTPIPNLVNFTSFIQRGDKPSNDTDSKVNSNTPTPSSDNSKDSNGTPTPSSDNSKDSNGTPSTPSNNSTDSNGAPSTPSNNSTDSNGTHPTPSNNTTDPDAPDMGSLPPVKKPKKRKNKKFSNGTDTPVKAGNLTNPDVNQFYIGQCKVEKLFLDSKTCDKKNPRLVKMEVNPIHYLFNPLIQVKKDFSAKGKPLDKKKMDKIYANMQYMFEKIQEALNPNLLVITKIESFKLSKKEASKKKNCLKIKHSTLEKINKSNKQTKNKFYLQEDMFIRGKHIPVTTFKHFGNLKKQYHIVSNGEEGMFWCLTRNHNTTPEELKSGKWASKKYLTEVKVVVDHDSKPFESAGFNCTETWNFVDKKTKVENRWHFCSKFTENFMDPNIITDVKFFEYHPSMGKCTDNHLQAYIDGKTYECDCDLNFNTISDEKKQGDTFLCRSRKARIHNKLASPNAPAATTGPNAKPAAARF